MAAAKDNEKIFLQLFSEKVRGVTLSNPEEFKIKDEKGRKLSTSVDYYFEYNNRQILIEVDSYNMAKVVIGQYLLLNQFCDNDSTNPLFLVVHTYSNYKPGRTIKYLEYVKDKVLQGKGMPFGVIHLDTFKNWSGGNADSFIGLFNA